MFQVTWLILPIRLLRYNLFMPMWSKIQHRISTRSLKGHLEIWQKLFTDFSFMRHRVWESITEQKSEMMNCDWLRPVEWLTTANQRAFRVPSSLNSLSSKNRLGAFHSGEWRVLQTFGNNFHLFCSSFCRWEFKALWTMWR